VSSGALRFPLATARLELRPFTLADAPVIHAVYRDPVVMRHVGAGPVPGMGATEAMLRDYIAHQERHGFSVWAVLERASGELIGDAGLYRAEGRGPGAELGYTLREASWGRGYATEAAQACVDAAFGPLELDELHAVADPANAESIRVLEKIGMRPDGTVGAYGRTHRRFRLRRPGLPAPQ
jgi:ribosomal-protein-alanine N-acetyltransferase